MLATATHKADPAHALQVFQERPSESFFGQGLCFFTPGSDLDVSGSERANAKSSRNSRFFLHIDVSNMDFRREIRIPVQHCLRLIEAARLIEVGYRRVT